MAVNEKDINLFTVGMEIVIYSNLAMKSVPEGLDFLNQEFSPPQKVTEHLKKGDIIGFNTGSSGEYSLYIRQGGPCLFRV